MGRNQSMKTSLFIAIRNLKKHWVSSTTAVFAMAVSGALLLLVWLLIEETEKSFQQNSGGFDAVLGARGSELQLVLNSVFHLDSSPGNIKNSDYEQIKKHPAVKKAIPIAVGDNYYGYRIVGTSPEYFTDHQYKKETNFQIQGRIFKNDEKEAIIGHFVAEKLKLSIGDTFQPYHGLQFQESAKHEEIYTITGILEKTGTPVDRVLWIPVSGVQNMEGHAASQRDSISAVLLELKGKAAFMLQMMYNKQGNRLTLVWPIATVLKDFFKKTEWATLALKTVGIIVAIIATSSIFAILFNSIRERRKEIAILRILGAKQSTILFSILSEGAIISGIGALLSLPIYMISSTLIQSYLWNHTGVLIEILPQSPIIAIIPLLNIIMGVIASVIPAYLAYKSAPLKEVSLS
jgi:putative ABC transport system permease protein